MFPLSVASTTTSSLILNSCKITYQKSFSAKRQNRQEITEEFFLNNSHSSLCLLICTVTPSDLQYCASLVHHDIQEPADKHILVTPCTRLYFKFMSKAKDNVESSGPGSTKGKK
jgi:hypothetical protein